MNLIIQILYRFAIVSLVVLLLSQTLGQYYWVFELFAHFVPHYTFLLGLSLAVLLLGQAETTIKPIIHKPSP